MYVVKNSLRALFVALIPLAFVEAVLLTMALLGTQVVPQSELPAPDQILLFYAGRLALYGALLFAGHWLLRQAAISSRVGYGLMGGAMAGLSYAFAIHNSLQVVPSSTGTMLTIGLLPAIAGIIAGFLYGQFAGLTPVAPAPGSPAATMPDETPAALTFDGPVRVRTSIVAISLAATMPAVLTAILSSTITTLLLPTHLDAGPRPLLAAAIPAQMFLGLLIATTVPSAIFVLALHHIARALHRQRGFEYAGIGSLIAVACVVLIVPFAPVLPVAFLLLPAIVYGAIMGGLYRGFAGIEPVPLPEPVIAIDPKALVAADDPSRRQHNVILSN